MNTGETTTIAPSGARALSATTSAYWVLRVGAALCFIGHGAFGFITKAAWLPYFAVAGIPEAWAWRLMPVVGAVDVMAGMAVLFAPRGLPLIYMTVWAFWTALLRPLAGEPFAETLERAGNYGVPLAMLLLTAMPRSLSGAGTLLDAPSDDPRALNATRQALRWTTVLLLAGHGMLGITNKAMLVTHYTTIGFPSSTVIAAGWFEMALAVAIAVRPAASLLMFVAAWKLATEFLFITAGAPIWEFVERAGSYAAPLALALLLHSRPTPR
ncbi:MAG TPA: hypothetical protein VFZ73_11365 [Gemmatimonadaceae bacterium]